MAVSVSSPQTLTLKLTKFVTEVPMKAASRMSTENGLSLVTSSEVSAGAAGLVREISELTRADPALSCSSKDKIGQRLGKSELNNGRKSAETS